MSELKPCPFCSGKSIVVKTAKCGRYIACWECGCRTEEFETDYAGTARDKAVAAWNRRAQPANEPLTRDYVEEAPAADVQPVVHGWWVELGRNSHDYETSIEEKCSLCGRYVYRYDTEPQDNYCPNCGARMEDEP